MPAGMDFKTAAAIPETYFTVWHNVFERGALKEGETILIHGGASGIGWIEGWRGEVLGADYRAAFGLGDLTIELFPAGHVLGSAQIRLEARGQVVVVSGDYKRRADPTCAPFEPLRCHAFVSEATFGLPIFRHPDPVHETGRLIASARASNSGRLRCKPSLISGSRGCLGR